MSVSNAARSATSFVMPELRPAKPEKCRKQTRKRLKALKGPKAPDGFMLHPVAIERRWIEAKCASCRACEILS